MKLYKEKNIDDILGVRNIDIPMDEIYYRYEEPHRKYHTISHLNEMLKKLDTLNLSEYDYELLVVSIIFHDIVYDPKSKTNEEDSIELFKEYSYEDRFDKKVYKLILSTKEHKPYDNLYRILIDMDLSGIKRDLKGLLEWEEGIRYEYNFVPYEEYKEKRIEFLKKYVDVNPAIKELINVISNKIIKFKDF